MRHFKIESEHIGSRLDQFIAGQREEFSRSYWSEQIKKGLVTVNERIYAGKYRLCEDDIVEVSENITVNHGTANILIPQPIPLNMIYETEHYCVINKQAGLVVHPGAGVSDGTLANGLIFLYPQCQNLPNWGLIHRLDKDTTGLMVVAKTLEGYCNLNTQMLGREITREYRALVMGQLRMSQKVESYLSRDPKNRLKKRSFSHPAYGKIAITHVKVLKYYGNITDILCTLETGRTHQIRVHLESIGHPLIGEQLYSNHPVARTLFPRQALHAIRLSFKEPCNPTGNMMDFTVSLPEDLERFISLHL